TIQELLVEKKWLEQFLSGQGYCIICEHNDPLDLEYHHVAGRYNDEQKVSVCRNCHGRLSRKQRFWPKEWTRRNNPLDLKEAFRMKGLSEVLKMKADSIFTRHE